MASTNYDYDAGELCLDFANTVSWHASEQPEDKLERWADLVRWGEGAGLLSSVQAKRLRRQVAEDEASAEAAFAAAIGLREAVYRIFVSVAGDDPVAAADLALLNEHLQRALPHLEIVPGGTGFSWEWREPLEGFRQIVWPVVRSAANLLTGERLARVGQCADDRGCGYLFIDTSRNRSRRWCSMESCGNRAKVQRYYGRQREGNR